MRHLHAHHARTALDRLQWAMLAVAAILFVAGLAYLFGLDLWKFLLGGMDAATRFDMIGGLVK